MLEREYKALLTLKQYELLSNKFCFEKEFVQVNLYYSPIKEICDETTIRVRLIEGKILLQLKELVYKQNGIHVKKEYEKQLSEIPYKLSGSELNQLTDSNKYSDSYLLGPLVTFRKEFRIEDNIVVLDHNQYCGTQDYELEIEFSKSINAEIMDCLLDIKIHNRADVEGKFTRFCNAYR